MSWNPGTGFNATINVEPGPEYGDISLNIKEIFFDHPNACLKERDGAGSDPGGGFEGELDVVLPEQDEARWAYNPWGDPGKVDGSKEGLIREFDGRLNTVLEERSYLDFYFPNSLIGKRRVAFFENPTITESRAPRYAKKNVVARNESVRMWVGTDARKVKLKFTYTLPLVAQFWALIGAVPDGFAFVDNADGNLSWKGVDKDDQDSPSKLTGNDVGPRDRIRKHVLKTVTKFFGTSATFKIDLLDRISFTNTERSQGPTFYDAAKYSSPLDGFTVSKTSTFLEKIIRTGWSLNPEDLDRPYLMATYYTMFAMETIRASVVGDTLNAGDVGPPLVRFRHGTMFNEVPFIVKNYAIDFDKTAGYEVRTLCPRKMTFTLDLEEFQQTHGAAHGEIPGTVRGAGSIVDLLAPGESKGGDDYTLI